MKKTLCIMMVLFIVLANFSACGSSTAPGSTATNSTSSAPATSSPSTAPEDKSPIKVAVVGPLTGPYAEYGLGFEAACEVMVEKWNNEGGINGKTIELLSYDEKGEREEGLAIAQLLAGEDNFYGVVGHFMSIMVVGGLYTEERIPMIGPSASSEKFTEQGDAIFRLNATILTETEAMLDCAKDVGSKKLGVVYLNDDWGRNAYATLQKILESRSNEGWEIVAAEEIAGGNMDYSPVLSSLKAVGAETSIMFCYYDSVVPFTIMARTVMPDLNIVCGVNCYNDTFLEVGGKDVEGCLAPSVFASTSENKDVEYFVSKFKDKMNGATPSSLSAQAYDAMGVLLTAINENKGVLDREAIISSIKSNKYVGVTGSCAFDEKRDAARDFKTMIVKDGQWVYY